MTALTKKAAMFMCYPKAKTQNPLQPSAMRAKVRQTPNDILKEATPMAPSGPLPIAIGVPHATFCQRPESSSKPREFASAGKLLYIEGLPSKPLQSDAQCHAVVWPLLMMLVLCNELVAAATCPAFRKKYNRQGLAAEQLRRSHLGGLHVNFLYIAGAPDLRLRDEALASWKDAEAHVSATAFRKSDLRNALMTKADISNCDLSDVKADGSLERSISHANMLCVCVRAEMRGARSILESHTNDDARVCL